MSGHIAVIEGEHAARLVVVDLADVVGQQGPHQNIACRRWIERWAFLLHDRQDARANAGLWLFDLSRQSSLDDVPLAALGNAFSSLRKDGLNFVLLATAGSDA